MDGGPDGQDNVPMKKGIIKSVWLFRSSPLFLPKPQENIDLLIDDIHGEDAKAIVKFHRSGGTILMERALGHLSDKIIYILDHILKLERESADRTFGNTLFIGSTRSSMGSSEMDITLAP